MESGGGGIIIDPLRSHYGRVETYESFASLLRTHFEPTISERERRKSAIQGEVVLKSGMVRTDDSVLVNSLVWPQLVVHLISRHVGQRTPFGAHVSLVFRTGL